MAGMKASWTASTRTSEFRLSRGVHEWLWLSRNIEANARDEGLLGTFGFAHADAVLGVQDLAVQVRQLDRVVVHDGDLAWVVHMGQS
jgi:hypothetical protein